MSVVGGLFDYLDLLKQTNILRDSFALPNPNDTIPVHAVPGEDHIRIPDTTIQIPVPPDGLGLDEEMVGEHQNSPSRPISTAELFVKDAFLVFRALCKLTMKPLLTER